MVIVWDWKNGICKSYFFNGNFEGLKILDMKFINEDDQVFFMSGFLDGVICIYWNYDSDEGVEFVFLWCVLMYMVLFNVNLGMVFDWQQVNGQVFVVGDECVIWIWNVGYEMCLYEILVCFGFCVIFLIFDQMIGNIFIVGFGDGVICVFDMRNRLQESMVCKWKDDSRQWV